jgi:hypothetical protein
MERSRPTDTIGMARFIVALLLLIFSVTTHAQSGWDYLDDSPERLIGLLDLPDIVMGGCGPAPARATARTFSAPSPRSPQAGTIYFHEEGDSFCGLMIELPDRTKERIPTLESGYEIGAAIVYERRGSWFRIRLLRGSAWITRGQEDFLAYPEMLRERLANTNQGWDGILRATPGASGAVTALSSGWKALLDRQLSVEYLGSRRVGNELWLHIRLAAKSACDQTYEGVTDVAGWIPAYRLNRAPSVWFASRGC